MELGLVGLGKMGGNMRERIRRAGHTVIGYDRNPDLADVHSLEELVGKLKGPRVVWVMVPAGAATQSTVDELAALLEPGDVVVDWVAAPAGTITHTTRGPLSLPTSSSRLWTSARSGLRSYPMTV